MNTDTDAIRRDYALPDIVARLTGLSLRQAGKEYRSNCPFHGGSSGTSFVIYWDETRPPAHWRYTCFAGCGSGDVIDFIRTLSPGMAFQEAIQTLTGQAPAPTWTPPPEPARQANSPIKQSPVQHYYNLLDQQLNPTTTPRVLWHERGVSDRVIERYLLGYCRACPTAFDKSRPDNTFASMTIPVPAPESDTPDKYQTIRHRLVPYGPGGPGDKYRPHRKGDGVALFGAHDLVSCDRPDQALIVEGEIKKLVLESYGLDREYVLVSATGGMAIWERPAVRDAWIPLFDRVRTIYVLLDPDLQARDYALKLARQFGRRGRLVHLPNKVDDFLLVDPDRRLTDLRGVIRQAQKVTYRLSAAG